MSVIEPVGRRVIVDILPQLALLAAFFFIWGCLHTIDAFVRALFGTISGAVGWIPYAGRILASPIHKIEQKVSHALGSAERGIDAKIATSFHKLAQIVRRKPGELLDLAKLVFGVTALLVVLPTKALVLKMIHALTNPLKSSIATLRKLEHGLAAKVGALAHTVAHAVWPRLRAVEHAVAGVIAHELPGLRSRLREQERALSRLRKWVKHRRTALTTGAFIGALVWALGRLGISWVRCSNVKRVGRALCRTDPRRIDALLGLLAGAFALAHLRELTEFASSIEEEVTHETARLLGVALPRGRFTIE